MSAYIDLRGASGAPYRFSRVENAQPATAHSGIYLYVREADGEPPVVLYADETENLHSGAPALWPRAVETHQATAIYTRLHVSSGARKAELADILAVITPPLNG